ncbi:histidinol dehydrogenase [Bacteroidota bacterium]
MEVYINPSKDQWPEIISRPEKDLSGIRTAVMSILEKVKSEGDRALLDLTLEFDGVSVTDLKLSEEEIAGAVKLVPEDLKEAIGLARHNIEQFHDAQKNDDRIVVTSPGVKCWTRTLPVEKVGLYIPGGTAPLLSTVLMLGIPARLAGCNEIVLCTPPAPDGGIHPSVLYCADILGIEKIYRVGGAQAIAAMAYGTETIPKVDKIFGPGNQYVTLAKQLVSLEDVAIDLPAGPSELAVIADETSDPAFVASDLISQAEHGGDSQVLLLSSDMEFIDKVQNEIEKQVADLPRKELAEEALKNSRIILLKSREDILELVNAYAPEHLIIACRDYGELGIRIKHAGSVFMGAFTPESAGDYASGTNHTLPTGGYARAYGGLRLSNYQKRISFQEISEEGIQNLGPAIMRMAEEEQLLGHSRAVQQRLMNISDKQS